MGGNALGYKSQYTKIAAAAAAKLLQSCPTLCNPIDGSQPGSPIPGILQARVLEWAAISFSNAWKWKVKVKSLSHVRLHLAIKKNEIMPFATTWMVAEIIIPSETEVAQSCPTLSDPMDCSLPGSSIHGIFQARVLEWVAIAFSRWALQVCN